MIFIVTDGQGRYMPVTLAALIYLLWVDALHSVGRL